MSRATREDRGGRPVRIPIGSATLEGDLDRPEGARPWCCLPTAAGAVGTARETAMWPGCSTRRAWPPSSWTSSPRQRRKWICTRGNCGSTSDCSPGASSAQPTGWRGHRRWRASRSATSGRAPAPRPPSSPRPSDRRRSAPSSRAAAAPTWPGPPFWVRAPTLLIVGGRDETVIALNRQALAQLGAKEKQLVIIPGATHLFEEPGALEEVARLAADWFTLHLIRPVDAPHAQASGRG